MAVAHDAASESHTGIAGSVSESSFTWNHVPTGTPRSALVYIVSIGANPVTGVTYGGTAMTAVPYTASDTDTEPGTVQAWFLDNVASGTQAVVVSRTSNTVEVYASCSTQTAASACEVYSAGVKTKASAAAEQTAASSTSTGSSTSWQTMSLDDGSPGTDSQRYMGVYTGVLSVATAGANTTSLNSAGAIDLGSYGFCVYRETTPSQGSKTIGLSAGVNDDLAVVGVAIRETPSPDKLVQPGAAAVTVAGATPAVVAQNWPKVQPAAAAVSIAGATPSVVAQNWPKAVPAPAAVAIAGATPTVVAQNWPRVQPAAASITVAGATPALVVQDWKRVQPAAAAVAIAGATPSVRAYRLVQPAAAAIVLTTSTPDVVALTLVTVGGRAPLGQGSPALPRGTGRSDGQPVGWAALVLPRGSGHAEYRTDAPEGR